MPTPKPSRAGVKAPWLPTLAPFLPGFFALACFWSVLGGGFLLWDDNINLLENPPLWQSAGKAFRWMFTDIESVQRYKPFSWVLWRLTGQAFGLEPVAFHALNLGLHAGNAVLLFGVIRGFLLTRTPQTSVPMRAATLAALAGTLWWTLHPLRVEPVAWISGAGYPLATFFTLLAVLAFQRHLRDGQPRYQWLAAIFFGFSLLSYPAAAALPGLLLALVLLASPAGFKFNMREIRRPVLLLLPYCVMAAAVLAATLGARLTTSSGLWNQPVSVEHIGMGTRMMQGFAVWGWYLDKALLPLQLSPVYPDFWNFSPTNFRAIISVSMIGLISLGAWRLRRGFPELPALWGAFLLLCVPVLGLTELPFSPADRYSYVPDLAVAILLASAVYRGLGLAGVVRPRIILAASAIVIGSCLLATTSQLQFWLSPVAFFNHAIAGVGPHPMAANLHWRLGIHYLAAQQTDLAVAEFEAVLRLNPNDSDAARYLRVLRGRAQTEASQHPVVNPTDPQK